MVDVHQLFIKTLLGTVKIIKRKCSHCSCEDMYTGAMRNMGGHFVYCPKCGKTDFSTYPNYYDTCIDEVRKVLIEKGFVKNDH